MATGTAPRQTAPRPGAFDELARRLDDGVASGALARLHGVVVLQQGERLFERYWTDEDEAWGQPLGRVAYGPDKLHDLRSVTKSIVGLLYGIALEKELVPPPETPLLEAFPGFEHLADDPRRRRETIEHALTMTMGNRWDEGTDYSDPKNAEHAMELSHDRVRFVLEQPMEREPGERWHYSGGATALLGALLVRGTGQTLPAFARERLFGPLGIETVEWVKAPVIGDAVPASGLRLRLRDLALVGAMVLRQGRWSGRQIVPAAWIERSMVPRVAMGESGIGYGYQWYLSSPAPPVRWYGAVGNGGQAMTLHREGEIVVAVNGGRYNSAEAWRLPYAVEVDHVFPTLFR
ncbi:MAG TPA: serine hydrolase [Kiloniellales bacterium]|nr:serine hydrolase [Kiloniellales bacterium]